MKNKNKIAGIGVTLLVVIGIAISYNVGFKNGRQSVIDSSLVLQTAEKVKNKAQEIKKKATKEAVKFILK